MALDLTPVEPTAVVPPGLEVRGVIDSGTLEPWRQGVDRGFGWPAYGSRDVADNLGYFLRTGVAHSFVAYGGIADDIPAASSLVFFGTRVAGLYHVSTAPDHRRRAIGSAARISPLVGSR